MTSRGVKALLEALELSEKYKPFQETKRRVFSRYGLAGSRLDRVYTALMYRLYRLMGILDKIVSERLGVEPARLPAALRQGLRLAALVAQFGGGEADRGLVEAVARLVSARFGHEWGDKLLGLYRGLLASPWEPRSRREKLELEYMMPWFLIDRLRRMIGWDGLKAYAEAVNTRSPWLGFRVNSLKASLEEVVEELEKAGVVVKASGRIPMHVSYKGPLPYARLSLLQEGKVVPQDEASAAAGLLLGAAPGERLVDLCAAPGGKTTHLAELSRNKAHIVAVELRADRMERLVTLASRTGTLVSIHPVVADARLAPLMLGSGADRVLVDPPCTSTGSLAKYPEARWRLNEKTIKSHAERQLEILLAAARLLKPGGRLLYTVCSVLPEEGEQVVQRALSILGNGYSLEPLQAPYDESPLLPGTARAWPHRHGTSGFFYAAIKRVR